MSQTDPLGIKRNPARGTALEKTPDLKSGGNLRTRLLSEQPVSIWLILNSSQFVRFSLGSYTIVFSRRRVACSRSQVFPLILLE
jgi:hypothetical protein